MVLAKARSVAMTSVLAATASAAGGAVAHAAKVARSGKAMIDFSLGLMGICLKSKGCFLIDGLDLRVTRMDSGANDFIGLCQNGGANGAPVPGALG